MEFSPVYPKEVTEQEKYLNEIRDGLFKDLECKFMGKGTRIRYNQTEFLAARADIFEYLTELYRPLIMQKMLTVYYEVTGLSNKEKEYLESLSTSKNKEEKH